jgi:cobalt-zinc-cadmium efflux system outer membrane protein
MKSPLLLFLILVSMSWNPSSSAAFPQAPPRESQTPAKRPAAMTLEQALARVFERNPEIVVSELEIKAASARVSQAGRKPNPEFVAETENLSTFGGAALLQYAESTLQVSQRMELGGKRALRVSAAEKEVAVASSQMEVKKVELFAAASQAFVDVMTEQERAANQQELSRLARESHAIVVERVAAGKAAPIEQTRATVALATVLLEEQKRLQFLMAAKDKLATLWGGSHQDIDTVQATFEIPPVSFELAASCLANNPELKLAAAAMDSQNAVLALELAARKPDLTFSAGFRRLSQDQKNVLVAGISIPLPVFDKREGAIAEARIRLDQTRSQQRAIELRLRASLIQARHEYEVAMLESKSLAESALPAAREAAAAVEEGYRLGKFDFLNVLDAQRTLAELESKAIDAVASGLKVAIELQRLSRCDALTISANPGRMEGTKYER